MAVALVVVLAALSLARQRVLARAVLRPSRRLARNPPHDEKGNEPKQIQPIPVVNDELGPPEKRVRKDELSGEFLVGLRGEGKLAEREILGQRKHSFCRAPSDRETTVERLPTEDTIVSVVTMSPSKWSVQRKV
jgi:hypothetical protein